MKANQVVTKWSDNTKKKEINKQDGPFLGPPREVNAHNAVWQKGMAGWSSL